RGAASLRRAALEIASPRCTHPARTAVRQTAEQGRRARHHRAAPPHPGAQPPRCARSPDLAHSTRRRAAGRAPGDETDGRLARAQAGVEETPRLAQGPAPGEAGAGVVARVEPPGRRDAPPDDRLHETRGPPGTRITRPSL